MAERPLVGVAVIICRGSKVLLGKRRSAHGAGAWGFPGGHLEFGESIEACARREVLEETGLELGALFEGTFTNDIFDAQKHYVTLYLVTQAPELEPRVMEPEKCAGWEWFEWSALPADLFLPIRNLGAAAFDPIAHLRSRHTRS